jgi:lipopolysaccharide export system protein LptA
MNDLAGRVKKRKQWAIRLVVGALVATLGVVVVTFVRRKSSQAPRPSVPALPKDVQQRLSGFTYTRLEGVHRVFAIHADRTLALETGGVTVLSNVVVEFFGRTGERHDILRTRRGTYYRSSQDFSSDADVQIELNAPPGSTGKAEDFQSGLQSSSAVGRSSRQPFFIETSRVVYSYKKSLVETAAPVQFRAGAVTGSALGMSYATLDGWVELHKDVAAVLSPQKSRAPAPPIHLSASKARFDKSARQAEFWGPVEFHQEDRTGEAQHAWTDLDDQSRVTQVKLEGQTKFSQTSPQGQINLWSDRAQGKLDPKTEQLQILSADGRVRGESIQHGRESSFEADRLLLNFAASKLKSGQGTGKVRVDISSSAQSTSSPPPSASGVTSRVAREELTADELLFAILPGSNALESANTPGPGRLILFPRGPKTGRRTVTASRFVFGFDSTGRLTTLRGIGGTRIEFMPSPESPKGTPPAITTAENLLARFDPANGTLQSAEQTGNFRFKQAEDQARGEKAVYAAADSSLVVTGEPQAWDPTARTIADRVKIDLNSEHTEGEGHVRVTRLDNGASSPLPSNVLADRATATRRGQTVHYSGNVRAWHGTDVIETSELDIDRAKQTIRAGPPVISSYMVTSEQSAGGLDSPGGKGGSDPLTIRAEKLDYILAQHKAVYRGKVVLKTQDTVLHADRLDVYLADSKSVEGSQVERAVAEGNVEVNQPGRRATGDRADYNAKLGKIVMTGGPPVLYDAAKGVTRGRRLTFFTLNDRLIVDGGFNSSNPTNQHVAP